MSSKIKSPFPPATDFLTRHGADLIATHLVAYWRARGFQGLRATPYEVTPGTWGVRSNMVGGIPPSLKWRR